MLPIDFNCDSLQKQLNSLVTIELVRTVNAIEIHASSLPPIREIKRSQC